ncbi:Fatty acid synthase [Holothuria leucospilota]|uniref:Fatty acid synthase n=1 Tax=Holothuria leucospilota TaxID=206669 RepID=A0A9Q1BNX2_HOLLE|nr:Fatty acid synthase [Holothuria leucospilota]
MACKDVLNGKCDYALVGAVNLNIRPQMAMAFYQLQVLSPDGKCKSFDKSPTDLEEPKRLLHCLLLGSLFVAEYTAIWSTL